MDERKVTADSARRRAAVLAVFLRALCARQHRLGSVRPGKRNDLALSGRRPSAGPL